MAPEAVQRIAQAKVTSRMQLTLPVAVQRALGGVAKGEYILFYEHPEGIMIKAGVVESKDKIGYM